MSKIDRMNIMSLDEFHAYFTNMQRENQIRTMVNMQDVINERLA